MSKVEKLRAIADILGGKNSPKKPELSMLTTSLNEIERAKEDKLDYKTCRERDFFRLIERMSAIFSVKIAKEILSKYKC